MVEWFDRRGRRPGRSPDRTQRGASGPHIIEIEAKARADSESSRGDANVFDPASAPVEMIHFSTFGQGSRIVALVGVEENCGVSTLCETLAARSALGGVRTLLLDISEKEMDPSAPDSRGPIELAPLRDNRAYDRVVLRPGARELYRLRDPDAFRRMLDDDFSRYQAIVMDAAPLLGSAFQPFPGRVAIVGADSVVVVCLAAQVTRRSLSEAMTAVAQSRAHLAGLVVNRRDQPSLGGEFAREAHRLRRWLPRRWLDWLNTRFSTSRFLDIHT